MYMLGGILLHQGLSCSPLGLVQKVRYADICGARKPTAIAEPPTISAKRLRILSRLGVTEVISTNSATANGIPLNNPLLRKKQENPNQIPAEIVPASWANLR